MRTNSLKKWVALFSVAIAVTSTVAFACADWFIGYGDDSSFTPEVFVSESYSPLFYSPQEPFYRIGYDIEHRSRFNSDIVIDWSSYLQNKVSKKDIGYLLLSDSASADVDLIFKAIQNRKPLPPRFANLSVTDEKVKSFITFLHFAKVIEQCSMKSPYSWDYEETTENPVVEQKTIDEVTKLYTVAKDPFLKNRYWFQVIKANFYSANTSNTISFFEKTKSTAPENLLYYRALAYVAGVHYSNKQFATSNYLYSVVFDKCPELRVVAAYNFRPKEDADFKASLAMAKTPEEKTALWALLGFYLDEKQSIQEIYKLNPKSEHLDYLLTRWINEKESLMNQNISEGKLKSVMKSTAPADDLQFIATAMKEGKVGNLFLWNSAAGYMNTFAGKYADATAYFDKAEKSISPDGDVNMAKDQIRLLRLINSLFAIDKLDAKTETKLVTDLDWLYHGQKSDTETFRYQNAMIWSKRILSEFYTNQQNLIMAELFQHNNHFFTTPSNVERMKAFLEKSSKSPWETMAAKIYWFKLSDIYEFQGISAAYQGHYEEAIQKLTAAKATAELPGNPFNGKIKDCHDCDHAAPQKVKYTKLSLVQKMKEMQEHVDKGEDVYNNSLLLANAYYNISYFGNARVFYYSAIIDQGSNYIAKDFQSMLFDCSKAKFFYQKAFDAAANDEQKAKCLYLMSKCERNAYYATNYHNQDYFSGDPEIAFLAWEGFQKLKSDYSHTKYYKDVINECGYFSKYIQN